MTSSAFHPEQVQGAARQSWRDDSPRALLKKILDQAVDPYDRNKVHDAFMTVALPDALFESVDDNVRRRVETMSDYWFDNNYRSAVKGYKQQNLTKVKRGVLAQERQRAKEQTIKSAARTVAAAIEVKAKALLLLQMTMPNGKPLAECSGQEVRGFRNQIPTWLSKIAERVPPAKIVGKVLSEDDVRKLAPKSWA